MKESIEETGSAVAHDLNRYLSTLGTLAAVTPLLGLFGTVIGMIEIFGSQAPTGAGNPAALAHGISIALYNTAFGIMVAVPALMFYRFFVSKVDDFIVEMEQQAIKLVEIVHGDADTIVPLDIHSEPLARLLPDATLTVLPGIGHMPHHAAPDAVVAAIDRVFARAALR